MERRRFQNEEDTFLLDVVKTSLGVFIGGLAAMFAYDGISAMRLEYAAKQLMQQAQQQEKAARAELVRQQQQQQKTQQQQQKIQQEREEERQALRRANQLAQRLERERQLRKEAAWRVFYQPSAPCRDDPVTAACANEHIAAKRRFEAQYVDR